MTRQETPPLTDAELARIEAQIWIDGVDDDRRLLLTEVKRLRSRAAPQRKGIQRLNVVVSKTRERLSESFSYQRVLEDQLTVARAWAHRWKLAAKASRAARESP